jgi:uncharacterized protein YkwD
MKCAGRSAAIGALALLGVIALLGALAGDRAEAASGSSASGSSASRPSTSRSSASASSTSAVGSRPSCKDTGLYPTRKDIARVTAATLCLIDRERVAYRLGALRTNSSLQQIAAGQAKAMVVGDYFGDDTPSGTTPWQRIAASPYGAGAHSVAAAQNIGWGTQRMATPAGMVSIWMHSPPHRQIVLTGGYRDIGIGVAPAAPTSLTKGGRGATYTVEFAVRG